jgi:hypothetical protein
MAVSFKQPSFSPQRILGRSHAKGVIDSLAESIDSLDACPFSANGDIGHPKLFITGEDSAAKYFAADGCE